MDIESTTDVAILGGGYAGLNAALRLARDRRSRGATITLVDRNDRFVERIRLHQLATGQVKPAPSFASLTAGTGIRFLRGNIVGLTPAARRVSIDAGGTTVELRYRKLVFALGSTVDADVVPGIREHGLTLASPATARKALQAFRRAANLRGRILICGGGLTGIECAAEVAEAFPSASVSLVTNDLFGKDLSEKGRRYLRAAFDRLGIRILAGRTVTKILPNRVACEGGAAVAFDACLWAGPFMPPRLARDTGLPVNALGQIVVDDHLRVRGHPDVYAVGDAASPEEAISVPIRMACATAAPMGAYVGGDVARALRDQGDGQPFRFRYVMRCISLGRRAALVQFVDAHDRPSERILTGRLAAAVKELVSRASLWTPRSEGVRASLVGGFVPNRIRVGADASIPVSRPPRKPEEERHAPSK